MSCTTAVMLQDRLNDIERNIYDGIDFRQELNEAYALADELQAENAKLRKLLIGAYEDMDAWQKVIASSDQWGYGKGCLDRLCELRDSMRELGIEVDG